MQDLTAAPRDALTQQQVIDLLQSPDLTMNPGVEILDAQDIVVADISQYLQQSGSYVSRDCNAAIHGTCNLNLEYELQWGVDRVRPFVVCSSGVVNITARFNLGIYIPATPDTTLGDPLYSVVGYDKLYFLNQPVGDSVTLPQGGDVLLQVENLIAAATNDDPKVNIDQSAKGTLLTSDKVYPLSSSPASYLTIINDALAIVGYTPIWVDQDGYYTSNPAVDPSTLAPEWDFEVQDAQNNIVADPRVRSRDVFAVPNWWRFIMNGLSGAPTEGNGQFTYQDNDTPLTGFGDRGYLVKSVVFSDAVDQETLQQVAALQILVDTAVPETWSVPSGPLPQSGHFDIVNYIDSDIDGGFSSRKCQTQSWTLQLDGSDMTRVMVTTLVLGT